MGLNMHATISELLWKLIREAKNVDNAKAQRYGGHNYDHTVSEIHASIIAYFSILYGQLPEDEFLFDYIPEQLEKLRKEIGEKQMLDKLES